MTASISGIVVNDEDPPAPIRRALVTLTGEGLRPNRGAITDDDGRFTIVNLPPGRFSLTVSKASYVTSAFGAKRPGRPGTAVAVAPGAHVRDLVAKLWRGAVIAGVVRDEEGTPVPGLAVTATPLRANSGRLLTLNNNGVMTMYRARTGERVFRGRIGTGGTFTASPVAADGRLYVASEDGEVYVVAAAPGLAQLANNDMGEVIVATPAMSDGLLIVRTLGHVYGIGRP